MKQKLIKYTTILSTLLYISITIFNQEIASLDELWNFSNAKNLANNLIPYKEFNLITTPLAAFLNSLSLKIFEQKLYIYRINYLILTILLILSISKLLTKFNINNYKKNIYIITISYLSVSLLYNDYNFLNIIFLIIILYLENQNNLNQKKHINLIIGLLCGLMILTKQTTGFITSFTSIMIPFITHIIYKDKNFKITIPRLSGILISLIPFAIYLYKKNTFYDFIDCTVLGLKTFQHSTNYDIIQITIIIMILILIIYLLKELFKIYKSKEKNTKIDLIIIIYSLSSLLINYPIIDPTHFFISIIPISILFIKKHKFKIKINTKIILIFLITILLSDTFTTLKEYTTNYKSNNFKEYQFIILNEKTQEKITNVTEYIQNNQQTVIIDHSAIIYMLPLNKYHHYFDIPLAGNIGSNGEKIMIKELQNKNITVLINKKPKTLEKELPQLYKYLMKNYKQTDEIENFQVLTKKTTEK